MGLHLRETTSSLLDQLRQKKKKKKVELPAAVAQPGFATLPPLAAF